MYGNYNTKKVFYCVLSVSNGVVLLALYQTKMIVLFAGIAILNIDSLSN